MVSLKNTMVADNPHSGFVGVVLAGGRSSRMGKDKSMLLRQQETMLEFTQQQLRLAGASSVLVSSGFNSDSDLADIEQDIGPLGGIYTVLSQRPKANYLFVPVDLPFLNPDALAHLCRVGAASQRGTFFQRQPIPLYLPWHASTLDSLANIVHFGSDLSIMHFLRSITAEQLSVRAQDDWFNANTPEDWQLVLERLDLP